MIIKPFFQTDHENPGTILHLKTCFDEVEPEEVIFTYAYATRSGYEVFNNTVGNTFWESVNTKWLIGIDYGRTDPEALVSLSRQPNTQVRIFNGFEVIGSENFIPPRTYHPKACFLANEETRRYGIFSGSGNFSYNGLINGVECGSYQISRNSQDEYERCIKPPYDVARALWDNSNELAEILDTYRTRWRACKSSQVNVEPEELINEANYEYFWIEAGYVTQNRGPTRPGNQIDLPRGSHKFFRLNADDNQERNTPIGEIVFTFSGREELRRNLRLGNNMMEKLTLPIPEEYGLGAYDDSIIEFQQSDQGVCIRVIDPESYFRLYRRDGMLIKQMGSGRLYGFR